MAGQKRDLEDAPPSSRVSATHALVSIPRLRVTIERESGRPANREVVVRGDRCRIGSHASNDVVLDDAQVSSFHCALRRTPSGWQLSDNGSQRGTLLAGVRVRDADLPDGPTTIQLGQASLRVSSGEPLEVEEVPASTSFGGLIGTSLAMRQLFALLERIAPSESTVLLEGESGTGKEVIALDLVRQGPRADAPLIVVDCGAIAPAVIESELFGHARGAFTGADRERMGAFEEASGGTLILDEIGELPLDMQPKLLRAIEAGQIRRVGENRPRRVDVRVIAATHRRLEREVNRGRFREDLFFRLSVMTVRVPPLRERLDDIAPLVRHFVEDLAAQDKLHLFTPKVLGEMQRHDWPGNVRELRNYVERTVVLDSAGPARRNLTTLPPGDEVLPEMPDSLAPPSSSETLLLRAESIDLDLPFTEAKRGAVEAFERRYLESLLRWSRGNVSQAARRAGMDRMHLHRLLQRHEIDREQFL